MEPSGSNLVQAGQYNFRLLFEECCKQEVEKEAGGGGKGGRCGDTSSSENYATKKYGARKYKID